MFLRRRTPSAGTGGNPPVSGPLGRHKGVFVAAGLVVLGLGLLLTQREREATSARPFGLALAPVQTGVSAVAGGITSFLDYYVLLAGARREAESLRREVADLRRELAAVGELALENGRLRKLLNFKESNDLPLLPARVVGRGGSSWFRTLVLDKGTAEGVALNSPVVTAEGVIGRVYQISASASRALLITDASSAIDAVVQRTRAQVIVEGRLGPECRIQYLARTDDAAPGDQVVTSGLGDVYPKGLLLGQISKVEPARGGVFRAATLAPAVDLSRLEEVFVIMPRDGTQPQ